MKWHPKVWGPGHGADAHFHTSVLQDVLPTRTGLRKLASTVAVYRVAEAVEATATTTMGTTMGAREDERRKKTTARKIELEVSRPEN